MNSETSIDWKCVLKNCPPEDFFEKMVAFGQVYFPKNPVGFLDSIISEIQVNEPFRAELKKIISEIFSNIQFRKYLTDTNILEQNSIVSIVTKKIGDMILPNIEQDQTLTSLLNASFYKTSVLEWFKAIPADRWQILMNYLYPEGVLKDSILWQISDSISILIDRVKGGYCDSELLRFLPWSKYNQGCFYELGNLISGLTVYNDLSISYAMIKGKILECNNYLDDILLQKDSKGISLAITIKINRLKQQLQRIKKLSEVFINFQKSDAKIDIGQLIYFVIKIYAPKNFVKDQLKSNLSHITFMATFHNGKTGEKYLTRNRTEYYQMLYSATMGGMIVAFLCLFKFKIYSLHLSPLFEALGYSLNYAIGFTAIYLFNFTLATKQPAMTAARIAQTLSGSNQFDLKKSEFSVLFARLFRSQFIAFIGNVLMSFLVATSIFLILRFFFGLEVIAPPKAQKIVDECVLPHGNIFYFGAIAGVFLFISGLSSGLFINYLRYINAYTRLLHHPLLKYSFSYQKRKSIVNWVEKYSGGIVGNVLLGFLLGFAFLVGKFMGFPFDIRHITFQAGNFALAIGGIGYSLTKWQLIKGFLAIFGVGWFNFIISFILSSILALSANRIPISSMGPLLWEVFKSFLKNPRRFFYV